MPGVVYDTGGAKRDLALLTEKFQGLSFVGGAELESLLILPLFTSKLNRYVIF